MPIIVFSVEKLLVCIEIYLMMPRHTLSWNMVVQVGYEKI